VISTPLMQGGTVEPSSSLSRTLHPHDQTDVRH
jgi:hypothetical protein